MQHLFCVELDHLLQADNHEIWRRLASRRGQPVLQQRLGWVLVMLACCGGVNGT